VFLYREAPEMGVAKQVERAIVVDNDGDVVMLVAERTGVAVENEEGVVVAVQTCVRGVVLGNVLSQQQEPRRAIPIQHPSTPVITQPSRDNDDGGCRRGCSCCCVLKWTLVTLVTIFCLPFLPLICIIGCCYGCFKDDD